MQKKKSLPADICGSRAAEEGTGKLYVLSWLTNLLLTFRVLLGRPQPTPEITGACVCVCVCVCVHLP